MSTIQVTASLLSLFTYPLVAWSSFCWFIHNKDMPDKAFFKAIIWPILAVVAFFRGGYACFKEWLSK